MARQPGLVRARGLISANDIGVDPCFRVDAELSTRPGVRLFRVFDRLHGVERQLRLAELPRASVQADAAPLTLLRQTFGRDYRLLLQVRHPHIVRAFDFGISDRGLPYYTQELVAGPSLDRWTGYNNRVALVSVLLQLLQALAALHARGVGGCGLVGERVVVSGPDGAPQARIIDVGDSERFGSCASGTSAEHLIRADLRDLGLIAYRWLVPVAHFHRPGQAGPSAAPNLTAPHRWDPSVPEGLSNVVMGMCQHDLQDEGGARLDSTRAAAEALGATGAARGRSVALPREAWTQHLIRCSGNSHRDAEVAQVLAWAESQVQRRAGGLFLLGGVRGRGKTPFLRHLAMTMTLEGFRVMRLVLDRDSSSIVLPLLRALRRVVPDEAVELPDPNEQELSGFAQRLGQVLGRVLGDKPTAIFVDERQRADTESQALLAALSFSMPRSPIVWIVASDDAQLESHLTPDGVLELGPLSVEQVSQLAGHRLHGLSLPQTAAKRIAEDSRGMPSLVERSLTQMVDEGTIVEKGGEFHFVGGRYRVARYAERREWEKVFVTLSGDEQMVLRSLAILEQASAQNIAHHCDREAEGLYPALRDLEHCCLVKVGELAQEPVYAHNSRLMAEIVLDDLEGTGQRSVWHDRAAGILRRRNALADVSEHELRGSSLLLALRAARARAVEALAVFSPQRAVEVLRLAAARIAVELDGPPVEQGQRTTAAPPNHSDEVLASCFHIFAYLAEALQRVGSRPAALARYEQALLWAKSQADRRAVLLQLGPLALSLGSHGLAQDALTELKTGEVSPAVLRLSARMGQHRGRWRDALADLEQALSQTRRDEPEHVRVLLQLAELWRGRGEVVSAVRVARRALSGARKLDLPRAAAEAHIIVGRGFVRASRYESARRSFSLALRAVRRSRDKVTEGQIMREIGNLYLRRGDYLGALQRYRRGLQLARLMVAQADEIASLHNMGIASFLLGRLGPAVASLRTAIDQARQQGDTGAVAASQVELGHVLAEQGQWVAAADQLSAALIAAERLENDSLWLESAAILAWVKVRQQNVEGYQRLVLEASHRLPSMGDPAVRALASSYFGRAALEADDVPTAARFSVALQRDVQRSLLSDFSAGALSLRASIAAHEGRLSAAVGLLREGLRVAEAAGMLHTEVPLRLELARNTVGSEEGVAHITRAMQLLRSICAHMPATAVDSYLDRREGREIHRLFRAEHRRVLGA